jgi:ComF family protein
MTLCRICNKSYQHYPFFNKLPDGSFICNNCFSSFPIIHKKIILDDIEVYCIYAYRQPINTYLMDLKMKGDIALSKVFLAPFKNFIELKYRNYVILPIPSTSKSDKKRGFNHIVEISKTLSLPIKNIFYKAKDYKQTSQQFENRTEVQKVIKMKGSIDKNKKYLLIDDVITSGNTIKACIKLLKCYGVKKIKVLVISFNYHK